MNCQCCGKKLRNINADKDFNNWTRKFHKKCWDERNIYYDLYLKASQLNCNPKMLEFYKKKSCIL